ncbi:MAG: hypothetical protein JXB15_14700 [Anaerolineales bacterium]|nr:hypothetical protein [Anaerolineales bacterium]
MQNALSFELAPLFQEVGQVLRQHRQALNLADVVNGNHGDHMVEIFELAVQAAQEKRLQELAEAMDYTSQLLQQTRQNGSALVYAAGLSSFANQFRARQISLAELLRFVASTLAEKEAESSGHGGAQDLRRGDVLKALAHGLAGWGEIDHGQPRRGSPLNMGALFEFGMAYLQAKAGGGSRAEILAKAAVSVSPLNQSPHRSRSGELAIQALLEAMQRQFAGPPGQADFG